MRKKVRRFRKIILGASQRMGGRTIWFPRHTRTARQHSRGLYTLSTTTLETPPASLSIRHRRAKQAMGAACNLVSAVPACERNIVVWPSCHWFNHLPVVLVTSHSVKGFRGTVQMFARTGVSCDFSEEVRWLPSHRALICPPRCDSDLCGCLNANDGVVRTGISGTCTALRPFRQFPLYPQPTAEGRLV